MIPQTNNSFWNRLVLTCKGKNSITFDAPEDLLGNAVIESARADSCWNAVAGIAELNTVIDMTNKAAHSIMDVADEIRHVINCASLEPGLRYQLAAAVTHLYEYCSFQELCERHIDKVVDAISALVENSAATLKQQVKVETSLTADVTQDDVDAILRKPV